MKITDNHIKNILLIICVKSLCIIIFIIFYYCFVCVCVFVFCAVYAYSIIMPFS